MIHMTFLSSHRPAAFGRRMPALLPVLALVVGAVVLQAVVPGLGQLLLSPLHVLVMALVLAGTMNASRNAIVANDNFSAVSYWTVAVIALAAFAFGEIVDIGIDEHISPATFSSIRELPVMIYIAVAAFSVGTVPFLQRGRPALTVGLLSLAVFGAAFAVREMLPEGEKFVWSFETRQLALMLQACGVLALGIFVASSWRSADGGNATWAGRDVLETPPIHDDGAKVGTRSRQMFHSGCIAMSARHPPVALAFRPGWQDVALLITLAGMLVWAARPVKRATGTGYLQQAMDMTRLWYRHHIDPPTYYALDLYKRGHAGWTPHLLTRFETKNGLLRTLNRHRPNPLPGHEMNDKGLFATACAQSGIAHPQTLMVIDGPAAMEPQQLEALQQDLFCKPRKTMGAKDTMTFKWLGNGMYCDEHGVVRDVFGVFASVALKRKPMLVQPWLRNHEEVAGFAKDSLIAIRVVTVLNENDEPEVTLAMLRLLSKLEPDWQHLPDGEYATPINLETAEMGLFTGDNFKTAPVRMTHHPVTGIQIAGRKLENWPAIGDLALKAHRAFRHRVVVGWDIALTRHGPVMLEGNTNLDVMFLQRVHDCPAGDTRFGALLNYQVHALYADLKKHPV